MIELKVKSFQTSDGKRHSVIAYKAVITISAEHAYSLIELVKHYRKMIEVMGEDASPLTTLYCDELLEDLDG